MRVLKLYAVPALLSAATLISAGYAQTDNAPATPAAVTGQNAGPQPASVEQGVASSTSPPDCPIRVPLTKEGDIKMDAGQVTKPAGIGRLGVRVEPRCPMPPIEFHPVVSPSEEIPEWVIYEVFFNNMFVLDQVADQDDKNGDHQGAALWRTHDQRAAGLNDAEGQIIKEVMLDCNRAVKAQDEKLRDALRKFRLRTGGDITAPVPPEMYQIHDERIAIIKAHIDQLRVALGQSSFQKLDTYIRAEFGFKKANPAAQGNASDRKP